MKTTLFVIIFLALSGSSFSQVNLNLGLLAYYPFNGNANDASGNANHGTPMNGVQLTTDKFGNANSAYQFDGVDDHIFLYDNGNLSPTSITVAAWVYAESSSAQSITGKIEKSTGNHATYHIGINYDIQAGFFWGLAPPNSNCFRQIPYNPNNPFLTSPEFFSTNAWHCVVGTFQDSVQKLYIDGVLVESKKYNFKNLDQCTNTNFLIGRWWDGDPIPFKGKIDEVRIYDRELSLQEISALCDPVRPCDSWLKLPSNPSFVKVGDLDIPGNKITIEAVINRITPYTGGPLWAGDIVSKHTQPSDVNYLLRPNSAEITTTNGYFKTPDICQIDLNKNYHVAMVYDGSFLKLYRNGFLMSQVAASGNLYQNNFETRIGWYFLEVYNTNLIGYINEVRIWNVARTQTELRTYMNTSLPSPTTQPGLLAYYVFDNLQNKQGNTNWNGVLSGSATILETNPACPNFSADSCCLQLNGSITGSTICNGGVAHLTFNGLNGTGPYSITYTDGTNVFSQNNVQNGVAFPIPTSPTSTTTYSLLSIKDVSCTTSSLSGITTTVYVNPNPQGAVKGDTICTGTIPSLSFFSTEGSEPFVISYTDGTSIFSQSNVRSGISFSTSQPVFNNMNYQLLSVTGANGCTRSTGFTQPVAPIVLQTNSTAADSISASNNNVCAGIPIQLEVKGGTLGIGAQWKWYTDSCNGQTLGTGNILSVSPSNGTTYFVRAEGECSRTSCVSLPIIVYPKPSVIFDSLADVCIDEPNFQITAARESSGLAGVGNYSGNGLSSTGLFSPSVAGGGKHSLTYQFTSANGCTDRKSRNIVVNPLPVVDAGNDLLACSDIIIQLNASGGLHYQWSPTIGLSNPSIANPTIKVNSSTTYFVSVTDLNGCSATDSVHVYLSPNGKESFKMSNAFTPNNDGKNDCFGIEKWGSVQILEFSIYNRWGQKVFTGRNASDCWDGSINGKKQDAGGYVYMIRANTACGEIFLKGVVMLMR